MTRMSRDSGSLSLFRLKNSLRSRLYLFLITALPTFLLTVIPNRLRTPAGMGVFPSVSETDMASGLLLESRRITVKLLENSLDPYR